MKYHNIFIKILTITIVYFFSASVAILSAQRYKEMMNDFSYNIYDVVEEAENYFSSFTDEQLKAKGSGLKGYQRWLFDNEYKYFPSGDRSQVDPFFASKAYNEFVKDNPVDRSLFSGSWEELGPLFIGQVTGHYAVGLGRIEAFYSDPSNNQLIYLGSRSGGFWKSTDGGTTWAGGTTDFLVASGVNTMTVSPTNPDSVLINIRNARNGTTHGIYRSVDAGDNWTVTNFNPVNLGWGGLGSNRQVYVIAYHPTIPDLVFVGTNNGLYRSTDNLATWTQLLNSYDITEIAFHPSDPNYLYCAANNDKTIVIVSNDEGLTFSNTSIAGNSASVHLSTSADCPDCVFVGTSNGIWKSLNSGSTFFQSSTPGISNYGAFAVSDVDTSIMLTGDIDTHMSTDGGQNFTKTTFWSQGNSGYASNTAYVHADIRGAICQNGVFWTGTDGFLCKSVDNGITWERYEGQGIREYYNLGVSQSNHYRTIVGSQDNGTSINTENGWIEFYGADGMEGIIHPLNGDYMIGSLQNGGRRKTLDGGMNQTGATPPGQTGYWIAPLMYDPNEQMKVYSIGSVIHRSEDFGETWTDLGTPSFSGVIKYATIAENNSDILVVASNSSIEKSLDGGSTFTDIKNNLPNISITDMAFDPNDDDVIVVTYGAYQNDNSKVYITTDQGATWQNITYNLNNMPVRAVAIDHTSASTIYLGTEIGIYKKAMSATTWSFYNPDFPNTSVLELEVMWGTNTLRAAAWGRGLWEYALDGREDFPAIINTSISNMPSGDAPKEGVDQYVTAEINYDNTLTNVYTEWSINSPTFGNVINMSNVGGDIWESDSPLPNYPIGTKMFFKVFAVGSSGDITETYKFMYEVKPFDYCEATGNTSGGNLYIEEFSCANMTHVSTNDNYTYYQDSLVKLILDQTYSITLNANNGWSSNDYAAWIDYNNDATFDSSEEILFSIGSGSVATANFIVPSAALTNDTLRMRTRLSYWGSNPSPCGNALGEVEDYPVWITRPCELTVNTTATSGLGSLPYAVDCAYPGETINFDSSLDGMTIDLGSIFLLIDKDLTILADPGIDITISANDIKPTILVMAGSTVILKNLSIHSFSSTKETILNHGLLTIEDVHIKSNMGNECVKNLSPASLTVIGSCQLEHN